MVRRSLPIVSAVLFLALLLTGCASKKGSLDSTADERLIVGSVAGYDVPMEIYRYVALNCRADIEGNDPGVWSGENGDELHRKLTDTIDETIVRMYTTVAMCEEYGISPADSYFEDTLNLQMEAIYESYGYDYKAYNRDLSLQHMNDSVCRFIVRDELLAEELAAKMIERGEIPSPTDADVFREIASGDEFVRVKQILVCPSATVTDEQALEKAEQIKKRLDGGADFDKLLWENGEDIYLFNNPDGYYISRGSYYTEFEDAAFSLGIGEISGIVKTPAGYSVIKRYEKEDSYIEGHLDEMYITYRDGLYNLALEAKQATLSVEWNENIEKFSPFDMK